MQIWDIWRIDFVIPVSLQVSLGRKNTDANFKIEKQKEFMTFIESIYSNH